MGRIGIILLLLLSCSFNGMPQCLCADMELRIVQKDALTAATNSDYSVSIVEHSSSPDLVDFPPNPVLWNGDTAIISFRTGGGIARLSFVIVHNETSQRMKVTVLNMGYDNPYLIEIDAFEEGSFLFDWKSIVNCQYDQPYERFITCDSVKFEQLQLKSPDKRYIHNEIRPTDLELFKSKQ